MLTRLTATAVLALTLTSCSGDQEATAGSDTGPAECRYPADAAPAKEGVTPPPGTPTVEGEVDAVIETSAGDIPVTLSADDAPCTVNSFVSLAGQDYYDGTDCHRLVPGFVLQCGDPTGTGSGGPGYSFEDELSGSESYPRGTLAMANAGPDTNGSQFFIVTADAALPPDYTVFGTVSPEGMEVVDAVEAKGNGPDGVAPAQAVTITDVAVG